MYVLNPTATTKITKRGVLLGQKKDAKWNHEKYSIDQKKTEKEEKRNSKWAKQKPKKMIDLNLGIGITI